MPTLIIPAEHSTITEVTLNTFWDAVLLDAATNPIQAEIKFGYNAPKDSVTVAVDGGTRYVSSVSGTAITNPQHTIKDGLNISGNAFITMLENLKHKPNSVNTNENDKSLLLLFVSEAARFEALRHAFSQMLQDSQISTIGQHIKPLVHVWEHLRSTADHKVTLANSDWYFRYQGHAAAPVGISNMGLAPSANSNDNDSYATIRSFAP